MASAQALPDLTSRLADLVKTVMSEIRPRLIEDALAGQHAESRNDRHWTAPASAVGPASLRGLRRHYEGSGARSSGADVSGDHEDGVWKGWYSANSAKR